MNSVVEERKMTESKREENPNVPASYGCEILLEKTTLKEVKDSSFPTDAKLIWYTINGENFVDLTRSSKRSDLFDFYYDKYGPGAVQKIDFGYGRISPKVWGHQRSDKKKRK